MTYKPGDVALYTGENKFAIAIKFGNWWTRMFGDKRGVNCTHVGIMVGPNKIVEALSTGVTGRDIETKGLIGVYRLDDLSAGDEETLKEEALDQVGEKYSQTINIIIGVMKFFHAEKMFKGVGYKGKNCSIVVGKCFDSIGYDLRKDECTDLLDPGDIAEHILSSNNWTEVTK